jgi:hypothetical protein
MNTVQQQQRRPFSGLISKARNVLQTMFYRLRMNESINQSTVLKAVA